MFISPFGSAAFQRSTATLRPITAPSLGCINRDGKVSSPTSRNRVLPFGGSLNTIVGKPDTLRPTLHGRTRHPPTCTRLFSLARVRAQMLAPLSAPSGAWCARVERSVLKSSSSCDESESALPISGRRRRGRTPPCGTDDVSSERRRRMLRGLDEHDISLDHPVGTGQ